MWLSIFKFFSKRLCIVNLYFICKISNQLWLSISIHFPYLLMWLYISKIKIAFFRLIDWKCATRSAYRFLSLKVIASFCMLKCTYYQIAASYFLPNSIYHNVQNGQLFLLICSWKSQWSKTKKIVSCPLVKSKKC